MEHELILTKVQAEKFVKEQFDKHTGEWITYEAINTYQKIAQTISMSCNQDIGELRNLRIEFQRKYDLNTVEAINLLNGFHVEDYLQKYHRIKNKIPLEINEKNRKCNSE